MGKRNTEQRKTSLVRIANLEGVVDDLLEHLETENLFDRLGKMETKHEADHRAIGALVESAQAHTGQLADLEDANTRARVSFGKLGQRLDALDLWPWQRAGRKVAEWFKTWF